MQRWQIEDALDARDERIEALTGELEDAQAKIEALTSLLEDIRTWADAKADAVDDGSGYLYPNGEMSLIHRIDEVLA